MTRITTAVQLFPAPPERAFALATEPGAWPRHFRGFWPLVPAIKSMRPRGMQEVGALREVALGDGTEIIERIAVLDAPRRHDYEILQMNAVQKMILRKMAAAWTFAPAQSGTQVTWTYR